MKKRKYLNQTERQKYVSEWEASGQTKKAYCEDKGLNYGTFISWFSQEKPAKDWSRGGRGGKFIELEPMSSDSRVEIKFPNGICLGYAGQLDEHILKSLYVI